MYKDKKTYLQVFALVALLILPLYIPTPLQLFWNTMTFFRFDRFSLLVSPFIAFMMALGIIYLMDFIKSKRINKNYIYSISIALLLLLATFSIVSTAPESDYGMDPERKYFNSAEVTGFNYVSNYVPYGSRLHSDYYTRRYLPYHRFSLSEDLGLPYYTGSFRNSLDIDNIDGIQGYILWRDKAFFESGLRLGSGEMIDIRASNLTERNLVSSGFERKNKIYSNSHIDIYH